MANTIKSKVLIPFTDKETKKQYKKGDIINLTAKRFNEIQRKGKYIEAAEEETTSDKAEK